MGTPDFAVPALQALIHAGHDVCCCYTQPPRPAGRGKQERRSAVHHAADTASIPVRTPKSLRDAAEQGQFASLEADIAVVAAYGLILPKPILEAPKMGCVNIHGSLLPRWRGAAPIQRAIQAGDTETGITIMQMDEGLDTGPMLTQQTHPITDETTGGNLHDSLAELGSRLLLDALDQLSDGRLSPQPQPDDGATYARKLSRNEAHIDWALPAVSIERMIRAFDPWPGAYFNLGKHRIKILKAEVTDEKGNVPGATTDNKLTITCGEGSLCPTRIQREGRSAMSTDDWLRGTPVNKGTQLT